MNDRILILMILGIKMNHAITLTMLKYNKKCNSFLKSNHIENCNNGLIMV